jgi:hypothetical protein
MNLSVLMPRKISEEAREAVDRYLIDEGFRRGEGGYSSDSRDDFLAITIDPEPEKDLYWTHTSSEVVWFIPMTEIVIESKFTEESHTNNYGLARKLAGMVRGVVYDHLVDVVYNAEGKPFEKYGLGESLAEYGAGITLVMTGEGTD